MEKWSQDFGKLFPIIFTFHFLASFLELTSCALIISLKNHGNQDKRKEGDLQEAMGGRQMEYEKLGRHQRDFANHEVWYLHQGQRETCVSVSQTKIFCSDALTGFFFSHCCHFCIFVYLDCGAVGACDTFGAEIHDISNQISDTHGAGFLLTTCHKIQSDQVI